MRNRIIGSVLAASLTLAIAPATAVRGADAKEAAAMQEKIQALRSGCAEWRNQINLTLDALNRVVAPGVELRPAFENYKAELAKMEAMAASARERATEMKAKHQAYFDEYEAKVKSIQNEDIREEAASRLAKRKKSYERIIVAMQDCKEELGPYMSDLNDIKTLLDSELTAGSVERTKKMIKKVTQHAADVRESIEDVEKELDRVTAELATYQ